MAAVKDITAAEAEAAVEAEAKVQRGMAVGERLTVERITVLCTVVIPRGGLGTRTKLNSAQVLTNVEIKRNFLIGSEAHRRDGGTSALNVASTMPDLLNG